MKKLQTIDDYLVALTPGKRTALQKLRAAIRSLVPTAEECISYQMPAFRLNGKMLVWFGAGANHCAFYPGAVVDAHKEELKGFKTSKGTIRFQPDHPLPMNLIRKLVKARMAKIARKKSPGATARRSSPRS